MARRQLLTEEQWARLLEPPSDEREIVRYYTLSRERVFEKSCKRQAHRMRYRLHPSYLEAGVRTYSTNLT